MSNAFVGPSTEEHTHAAVVEQLPSLQPDFIQFMIKNLTMKKMKN